MSLKYRNRGKMFEYEEYDDRIDEPRKDIGDTLVWKSEVNAKLYFYSQIDWKPDAEVSDEEKKYWLEAGVNFAEGDSFLYIETDPYDVDYDVKEKGSIKFSKDLSFASIPINVTIVYSGQVKSKTGDAYDIRADELVADMQRVEEGVSDLFDDEMSSVRYENVFYDDPRYRKIEKYIEDAYYGTGGFTKIISHYPFRACPVEEGYVTISTKSGEVLGEGKLPRIW